VRNVEGSLTHIAKLRALVLFVLAYVAISAVGIGAYLLVAALMGSPPSQALSANSSAEGFRLQDLTGYPEAQRFFPLENLMVWSLFAWWYFRGKRLSRAADALPLAAVWAGLAISVDFLAAVALPIVFGHPQWLQFYALSPYSFYV